MARSAIAALLFGLLSACIAIGDGGVRASGMIRDVSGSPVNAALVFFDDPARQKWPASFETRSRTDGSFELGSVVAPGRYTIPLVVGAPGFKEVRAAIPTLSRNRVEVTLVPVASSLEGKTKVHTEKEP